MELVLKLKQRRGGRRVRWSSGTIFEVILLLEMLLMLLDLLLNLFEIAQARQWVEDLGQTTRRTFIGHCLPLAADLPHTVSAPGCGTRHLFYTIPRE